MEIPMKLAAAFAVLALSTAPALAGGYDDVDDGYGGYGATVVVTKRVIYAPPRPVYHVRRVIYAPAPYYGHRHYGGYYGVRRAYWGGPGGGYYGVRRAYWGGPGGGYYGVRRAYWGGPGGGYYGVRRGIAW
jgi:hypothetical protein